MKVLHYIIYLAIGALLGWLAIRGENRGYIAFSTSIFISADASLAISNMYYAIIGDKYYYLNAVSAVIWSYLLISYYQEMKRKYKWQGRKLCRKGYS